MSLNSARRFRLAGIVLIALVTSIGSGLVVAGPAAAVGTDRYVATTGDDTGNDCTDPQHPCQHIGYAINTQAEANDTVHIAAGTYDEAEIGIDFNLTVVGATDGTTTVDGSGEGIFGVFGNVGDETSAPTVTFENMNISGNPDGEGVLAETADVHFVNAHVDGNAGPGVVAEDATVEASGSTFNGNGTDDQENGPFTGGLVVFFGAATVDHSTVDGNFGAGILLFPEDIFGFDAVRPLAAGDTPASVRVDHSTVSNNGFGGVLGLFASISVADSTVSGNTGFGIENAGGIADVENSTVTGTKAAPVSVGIAASDDVLGAGIDSQSVQTALANAPSAKKLKAVARRVTRGFPESSVATSAPKISRRIAAAATPGDLAPGQTAVVGSIVAAQDADVPDCTGTIVDGGYNLDSDSDNTCGFSADMNDVVSTDPLLGPLGDNGGPTLTHLPKKGSAAIDAIPTGSANCSSEADDQRGVRRPQGPKCDIGAVEVDETPIVIHPPALPHGTVGKPYSVSITATGGLGPPYAISLVAGDLPGGLTFGDGGVISGTPTESGHFPITVSVDDPVTKDYVLVIEAAAVAPTSTAAPTSSPAPIANTGANTKPLTTWGITGVVLGVLFLLAAGWVGRERYRRAH